MPNTLRGTSFAGLILPALVVVLGASLYRERSKNATLTAELKRNIQPTVLGAALPEIPFLRQGHTDSLRTQCGGAPLVLVFSARSCKACTSLPRMITAVPPSGRGDHLIVLGIDGPPLGYGNASTFVGMVEPGAVTQQLGIREVPSVIVTDSACRVVRRAVGPTATGLLLEALARKG